MGWGDIAQIQELTAEITRLREALRRITVETSDEESYHLALEALEHQKEAQCDG